MKLMTAIAAAAFFAGPAGAQMRAVTAVRHWTFGSITRIAIEVSGEFEIRSDRLHDPERVYFDIHDARPLFADHRRFFSDEVDDGQLKRVRVAETTPGTTRVVLDLADGVEATPSQLSNPDRLMIELRHSQPAPDTTAPTVSVTVIPVIPAPSSPVVLPAAPKLPLTTVAAEPSKTLLADVAPASAPGALDTAGAVDGPPAAASVRPTPALDTAKSARHTSSGESSLIRALGLKINRVVIDPGHGGHDQGTSGSKGLLEKDLVLDVSLRLGKLIEQRLGAEVIYTRTDDTFVPLESRTAIANDKKADLFLSIHANSSPASHVTGIETYYLNFTDSRDALDLAARENASSQRSVFELRDLIQKITAHDKAEESHEFANRIQNALSGFTARYFPNEKNRGVRTAPFVVLIGANMPSVLAEIGFLSNSREETLLKKPDYRQKLADALFRGVSRYADSLSHFQMALN